MHFYSNFFGKQFFKTPSLFVPLSVPFALKTVFSIFSSSYLILEFRFLLSFVQNFIFNSRIIICSNRALISVLVLVGFIFEQFSVCWFFTILKHFTSSYLLNYNVNLNRLNNYIFNLFQPIFSTLPKRKTSLN